MHVVSGHYVYRMCITNETSSTPPLLPPTIIEMVKLQPREVLLPKCNPNSPACTPTYSSSGTNQSNLIAFSAVGRGGWDELQAGT